MVYIESAMQSIFAADICATEEEINRAVEKIRANPDRRQLEGIIREFRELSRREDVNWIDLLENDEYEVESFDNQQHARMYILTNSIVPLER